MKKFIAVLLCMLFFCSVTVCAQDTETTVSTEYLSEDIFSPLDEITVPTAATGQIMEINAKSVILMEPKTGKILYESNADEPLAPASITKITALLLVMEAISDNRLSLDTLITASEHACSMGGSQIWLEPGEQMTVDDLLKAVVIASANDAIVALGEAIAGSEEGFVALMNEKAAELGMTNTHYKNCTGLDAEGHLTSAHDVAIVSSALISYDLIKNYSTVWMDSLRDGKSELVNTNKLVRFYEGCTGLKTGTTSTAGHCLAATAKRDNMELVAVVMNAPSSNDRFTAARKLLDYGFANFKFTEIPAEIAEDAAISVKNGTVNSVTVTAGEPLNLLLPRTGKTEITQTIELPEFIDAPVKQGDTLGFAYVFEGENQVGAIPLTAGESVDKMTFMHAFWQLLRALVHL